MKSLYYTIEIVYLMYSTRDLSNIEDLTLSSKCTIGFLKVLGYYHHYEVFLIMRT